MLKSLESKFQIYLLDEGVKEGRCQWINGFKQDIQGEKYCCIGDQELNECLDKALGLHCAPMDEISVSGEARGSAVGSRGGGGGGNATCNAPPNRVQTDVNSTSATVQTGWENFACLYSVVLHWRTVCVNPKNGKIKYEYHTYVKVGVTCCPDTAAALRKRYNPYYSKHCVITIFRLDSQSQVKRKCMKKEELEKLFFFVVRLFNFFTKATFRLSTALFDCIFAYLFTLVRRLFNLSKIR